MAATQHTLENLLRRATADAAHLPALRRALQTTDVFCLGECIVDPMQRPWTQINGCHHAGSLILPCFLSEHTWQAAGSDQLPYLFVAFSEFVRAAQGYNTPIVIDPGSPHAYTILPEVFHLFRDGPVSAAQHGSAWH